MPLEALGSVTWVMGQPSLSRAQNFAPSELLLVKRTATMRLPVELDARTMSAAVWLFGAATRAVRTLSPVSVR